MERAQGKTNYQAAYKLSRHNKSFKFLHFINILTICNNWGCYHYRDSPRAQSSHHSNGRYRQSQSLLPDQQAHLR